MLVRIINRIINYFKKGGINMATVNTELLLLHSGLLRLYLRLRINAGRASDMPKYNALKALQPQVDKALFSDDIDFVESVYNQVTALI